MTFSAEGENDARLSASNTQILVPQGREPIEGIVESFTAPLRGYLRLLLPSDTEVFWVMSSTFRDARENVGFLSALSDADTEAWLTTLSSRHSLRLLADGGLGLQQEEKNSGESQPPETSENDGREYPLGLLASIGSLPIRHRTCWLLVEVGNLAVAEISEAFRLSDQAARKIVLEAREHLVACMTARPEQRPRQHEGDSEMGIEPNAPSG